MRTIDNAELAPRIASTPEWIFSHTGIESRHIAAQGESASTMGAEAARHALDTARTRPEDIGMVAVATSTPDYGSYPSTACLIQNALGCANAAAFDLAAACSGFVYGLEMVRCYLLAHPDRKALVVGTEVLSRQINWSDRSSAMLFGDGAGAVVLEAAEQPGQPCFASLLGADGNGARFIMREAGLRRPLCDDPVRETVSEMAVPYLSMDGHAVFAFAVRKLDEVLHALCAKIAIAPAALDLIFAHQANSRIIEAVARRMDLPMGKFFLNLKHVGNTSSASIPLCLDKAVREKTLKDGMRIALAGFGSGLTWAGMFADWPFL